MASTSSAGKPHKQLPLAQREEVNEIHCLLQKAPPDLADHFAIGELLRNLRNDFEHTRGWRKLVAEEVGCSEATLNKCLQFQEKWLKGDLPELEKLGVGWGRLMMTFGLRNKRGLKKLLAQAPREKWSERQLQQAVQQRNGSCRGGGRKHKHAQSHGLLVDVNELIRLTQLWMEFFEEVWSKRQGDYAAELEHSSTESQQSLAQRLDVATARLQDLGQKCVAVTATIQHLRKMLP